MNQSASARFHLGYNPAWDGLRGVAVAAVVVNHLLPTWLPGGFLGVDLFFVLSGFLISTLLIGEHSASGTISFGSFYGRRLRRLMPAMLVVLMAVVSYALFVASSLEVDRIRRHAVATLAYVANWVFISDKTSYVDVVSGLSPLRHTWSLAIEEQFYLVIPALVWALGRSRGRKRRSDSVVENAGDGSRPSDGEPPCKSEPSVLLRRVAIVSCVGFVASAVAMAMRFDPDADSARVYFGTDTRVFALFLGVLAAVFFGPARTRTALAIPGWVTSMSVAGFAAMLWFGSLTQRWMYPAGFVAVAVLSGVMIIAAAQPGGFTRALSIAPLVFLGRISYGVYLWHWPVRVLLTRNRAGVDGIALAAAQATLSIALATASYYLIERPVQQRRWFGTSRSGNLRLSALGGAVLLLLSGEIVALPNGRGVAQGVAGGPASTATDPAAFASFVSAPSQKGVPRVVIFGDSVAHTLAGGVVNEFPHFEQWAPSQVPPTTSPLELWSAAHPGCSFIGPLATRDASGVVNSVALDKMCPDWPQPLERLASLVDDGGHIDAVAVALSNDIFDHELDGQFVMFDSEDGKAAVFKLLDRLHGFAVAADSTLILLALPPRVGSAEASNDLDRDGWREKLLRDYYSEYASSRSDVTTVDLGGLVCPSDDCDHPFEAFEPSWRYDGLHFTRAGASAAWNWMLPRIS